LTQLYSLGILQGKKKTKKNPTALSGVTGFRHLSLLSKLAGTSPSVPGSWGSLAEQHQQRLGNVLFWTEQQLQGGSSWGPECRWALHSPTAPWVTVQHRCSGVPSLWTDRGGRFSEIICCSRTILPLLIYSEV